MHIGLDGMPRSDGLVGTHDAEFGADPALVWLGSETLLLYGSLHPCDAGPACAVVSILRLSAGGAPDAASAESPKVLDLPVQPDLIDGALAAGSDILVTERGPYGASLLRLNADGALVWGPYPIAVGHDVTPLQQVTQGGDAVMAWWAVVGGRLQTPAGPRIPTSVELARIKWGP
jgi:hypothetical protein